MLQNIVSFFIIAGMITWAVVMILKKTKPAKNNQGECNGCTSSCNGCSIKELVNKKVQS